MYFSERNRYLQILHKNGATRKQIERIMEDVDKSQIFQDIKIDEEELLEKKIEELMKSKIKEEKINEKKNNVLKKQNQYGRNPLHEAIVKRDIQFVKKCIKEERYIEERDNNGFTPREMAYYMGWTDVIKLFDEIKKLY